MKLEISGELAEELKAAVPECNRAIARAMMYDKETFELEHSVLGEAGLETLYRLAKQNNVRGLMMQITSLQNILKDPVGAGIGSLKAFQAGLVEFLRRNAIDGWLYEKDSRGEPMPSLVTSVRYEPADRANDRPAKVRMHYCRNRRGKFEECTKAFELGDVQKKRIPEVLAGVGLHKETAELKGIYEAHLAKLEVVRPAHGEQFVCSGQTFTLEEFREAKSVDVKGQKMVNDESGGKTSYRVSVKGYLWEDMGEEDGKFDTVPMHPFVYMFDLGRHENCWVHVGSLWKYQYKPELREKLVLPELHRDLVDVLTSDLDVLVEDIVDGKTGGTIILCKGAPGLGKTLTAEVYSEVMGVPLYRVHSGQLGTTAGTVETSLAVILERATRWGCALLIDEADTFVKQRGEDMEQNAVVAVFLRVLETYPGLLFMTSNRSNDIDDAILSRCIAIIKYEKPDEEDCKRLWKILSKQFEAELDDEVIDGLLKTFGCVGGRDIKGLVRLTSRFCRKKKVPYTVEAFRQCAQFKGIV